MWIDSFDGGGGWGRKQKIIFHFSITETSKKFVSGIYQSNALWKNSDFDSIRNVFGGNFRAVTSLAFYNLRFCKQMNSNGWPNFRETSERFCLEICASSQGSRENISGCRLNNVHPVMKSASAVATNAEKCRGENSISCLKAERAGISEQKF